VWRAEGAQGGGQLPQRLHRGTWTYQYTASAVARQHKQRGRHQLWMQDGQASCCCDAVAQLRLRAVTQTDSSQHDTSAGSVLSCRDMDHSFGRSPRHSPGLLACASSVTSHARQPHTQVSTSCSQAVSYDESACRHSSSVSGGPWGQASATAAWWARAPSSSGVVSSAARLGQLRMRPVSRAHLAAAPQCMAVIGTGSCTACVTNLCQQ
jgi:hypothetical protein